MHRRSVKYLTEGKNVIYDALNITKKNRANIIVKTKDIATIEAHVMQVSVELCIKRDADRERSVGKEVIEKCARKYTLRQRSMKVLTLSK